MKMLSSWETVLSSLLVAAVVVLLIDPSEGAAVPETEDGNAGWRIMTKVLDDCASKDDTSSCLGLKATAFLERASRVAVIPVVSGVTLLKDVPDDSRSGRALTEAELENSLPSDPAQRPGRVFDLFTDAAVKFLQSHTLQFKLPAEDVARSIETGRAKIKKLLLPLLLGGGLKFLLIPLALGAIALIAFKALAIGKLALLIAGVVGAQKLFGGHNGGLGGIFGAKTKTIEVVTHPVHSYSSGGSYAGNSGYSAGGSQGGYSSGNGGFSASSGGWSNARTLDEDATHKLVFRGQAPSDNAAPAS